MGFALFLTIFLLFTNLLLLAGVGQLLALLARGLFSPAVLRPRDRSRRIRVRRGRPLSSPRGYDEHVAPALPGGPSARSIGEDHGFG